MLSDIQAIVLAAGKSTRLGSPTNKLTEKICGQELIMYPITVLAELAIPTTLTIGYGETALQKIIEHYPSIAAVQFVEQHEQTGTGHAALLTKKNWHYPTLLIMHADIPLITPDIITDLYTLHTKNNAAISFIAAHHEEPTTSYRRVIKKKQRIYIRDQQELSAKEIDDHCCITTGIYCVSRSFLEKYGTEITQNTSTNEYHFSDLINIATDAGETVAMMLAPFDNVRGIDTYQELWAVEHIQRSHLIRSWMDHGVRFSAPNTVHIDLDVHIGTGSFIGNGVHIINGTIIGANVRVDSFSIIDQATLGDHTIVHPHSIIKNSTIGDHAQLGPFAHIQSDTIVGNHCVLGNFVETKRTKIGNHSKAKHLTYLGDAQIGSHVNIGAGTITCNYDGKTKHTTHIEDHVFIGSNNSLVAPVTIEKEAFTAAGSVITHNVPSSALAIARARQVNKEGYARTLQHEVSQEEDDYDDTKQSLSFIGATKSSRVDL